MGGTKKPIKVQTVTRYVDYELSSIAVKRLHTFVRGDHAAR